MILWTGCYVLQVGVQNSCVWSVIANTMKLGVGIFSLCGWIKAITISKPSILKARLLQIQPVFMLCLSLPISLLPFIPCCFVIRRAQRPSWNICHQALWLPRALTATQNGLRDQLWWEERLFSFTENASYKNQSRKSQNYKQIPLACLRPIKSGYLHPG